MNAYALTFRARPQQRPPPRNLFVIRGQYCAPPRYRVTPDTQKEIVECGPLIIPPTKGAEVPPWLERCPPWIRYCLDRFFTRTVVWAFVKSPSHGEVYVTMSSKVGSVLERGHVIPIVYSPRLINKRYRGKIAR
jgi:hypothetical protein